MATVKLSGIHRRFNQTTAIENITFTVPDGEFWVLVGPSGCGKSTILRTIAGLETASEGDLYFGETLVNQIPARARDVAMVFQNYALYPHMNVAENLAFGLKMRNLDPSARQAKVQQVAEMLNIAHLLDRKPKQLSGGQQQRVALGRAIIRRPQVFLLDEPLSNLDAQLRDETRAELKQLHQKVGITTIYVTHDQVEAMTLADQIVILDRGQIQQIGSPQAVYHQPANRMVASFLGNPPMNILPATYDQGVWRIGDQTLPCPPHWQQISSVSTNSQVNLLEAVRFDLGIRPEHLHLYLDSQDKFSQPSSIDAALPINFPTLRITVDLVEPLGKETLIRGRIGTDIMLNLQGAGLWQGKVGDRLSVAVDLRQLFLFDYQTGKTLIFADN
ncbi:MAG: ABC transporter ATP-binding protein [Coleofasciculaceae cyanobacterium SM2_1_6]|nr:ABC transporter ATP-binding protein [Coleofasciculaceae cyanobacterium SM2_1_6]